MKRIYFFIILLFLGLALELNAQVPQLINYQALLTDASGNSIHGSKSIQFSIYNTATGGTANWSETQTVNVNNGLFNAILGSVNALPYSLFDGSNKYLAIKVETDAEMTPRKQLVSVGYSFRAYQADKLDDNDATDFIQLNQDSSISNNMLKHNAVTAEKILPTVVSSLNSVTNDGGNIDLIAGSNINIVPDDTDNRITISATAGGGGDITAVNAGNGLTGGGDVGDVNLNVGVGKGIRIASDSVSLDTVFSDNKYVNENQFNSITSQMIKDDEITINDLSANSVGSGEVIDNSITADDIAPNSVGSSEVIDNSITATDLSVNVVSSIDGVTNNGGNVDLVAGNNITLSPDDTNNRITISATGAADNLGNHRATQNLNLNGHWLSGDGEDEGVIVKTNGNVGIGTSDAPHKLEVNGDIKAFNAHVIATNNVWSVNGDLVSENGSIRTGGIKPAEIGAGDIYAKNNITADGNIRSENMIYAKQVSVEYMEDEEDRDSQSATLCCNWIGVTGYSFLGTGVYGRSYKHIGVFGYSTYDSGVQGYCLGPDGGAGVCGIGDTYGELDYADGIWGFSEDGTGIYGHSTNGTAGGFTGDVIVSGTLTKGAGAFKIDHPLDPANKYLCHSFVESPDMMNIYNGNATLDANGETWIELSTWFGAINKDFRYQLTAIGAPGPNLFIAEKIANNRFKIAGGTAAMEVSWQVTGIHNDDYANSHRIQVEIEKNNKEKGKYLHPKEHSLPESMSIDYDKIKKMEESKVEFENKYKNQKQP